MVKSDYDLAWEHLEKTCNVSVIKEVQRRINADKQLPSWDLDVFTDAIIDEVFPSYMKHFPHFFVMNTPCCLAIHGDDALPVVAKSQMLHVAINSDFMEFDEAVECVAVSIDNLISSILSNGMSYGVYGPCTLSLGYSPIGTFGVRHGIITRYAKF